MKKPTLSILPLATLLVAGCTTDDYASRASSPWQAEGTGGQPNPIVRTFTTEDGVYSPDEPLVPQSFPLIKERAKPVAVKVTEAAVNTTPPEDPNHFRITDIRANYAVFQFVSLGKFEVGKLINANDGKSAAQLRVLELDEAKKAVVVEIVPGKIDLPKFEVGGELGYVSLDANGNEFAATADGSVPSVPAVEPAIAPVAVGPAPAPAGTVEEPPAPPTPEPTPEPTPDPVPALPVSPESTPTA